MNPTFKMPGSVYRMPSAEAGGNLKNTSTHPVVTETPTRPLFSNPARIFRNADFRLPPSLMKASPPPPLARSRRTPKGFREAQTPPLNYTEQKTAFIIKAKNIQSLIEIAAQPLYLDIPDYLQEIEPSQYTLTMARAVINVIPFFNILKGTEKERIFYNLVQLIQDKRIDFTTRQFILTEVIKLNNLGSFVGLNLSSFNLRGLDMRNFNLSKCLFTGANLERVNLANANLQYATFTSANLYSAILCDADMSFACFDGADLHYADLSRSCMYAAYLGGTNFTHALLDETRLGDAKFEGHPKNKNKFGKPDFSTAKFVEVSLSREQYSNAILEKTDRGFSIPANPAPKKRQRIDK